MTKPILDEATRDTLIKGAMPYFRDLAYMPIRTDLGIEDSATAIDYDTAPDGPYGSVFGNAVGGEILGLVLDAVGPEAFVEGQTRLVQDVEDRETGWSDKLMYERMDESYGYGSTRQVMNQLHKAYPGFSEIEDRTDIYRALYAHAVDYARFEIARIDNAPGM